MAMKKRKAPKKVKPINYNGIKYITHRKYFTHYIVAIQQENKEELWKQEIYTDTINENRETDVQIRFINGLELDNENNQLIIKSENHNFYTLDLTNRTVDYISMSSFELGECILTYDLFKKEQQEWKSKEKQSFTWLNNKKARVFIQYIDLKKDDNYIQQIDKTLFNLTENADTVKFEIAAFLNLETKLNSISAKPEIIFSQCSLLPIYIYKKGDSIYMEITFRCNNDDYVFYLKDGLTYKKRID